MVAAQPQVRMAEAPSWLSWGPRGGAKIGGMQCGCRLGKLVHLDACAVCQQVQNRGAVLHEMGALLVQRVALSCRCVA